MLFVIDRWKPRSHRSEYGSCWTGARKLIACPMNVLDPSDDPAGCTNPFGNGLLRILALVRLLFEVDDVRGRSAETRRVRDRVRRVGPRRRQICQRLRLHKDTEAAAEAQLRRRAVAEADTRANEAVVRRIYRTVVGRRERQATQRIDARSPSTLVPFEFVTVVGLNFAVAPEAEFVAVGLKPFTVWPSFSSNGVSMSNRMPRLTVNLLLTRQSSCTNVPK